MTRGLKIAVGGKGGVGKTTVSAILARLLHEDGFDVLAVDADPDANLCGAFGLTPDQSPEPLIRLKSLIAERLGTDRDAVGAYFRMNPEVQDLPAKHWVEVQGVKVLVLGAAKSAGGGCACAEGAFLRALLSHTVLHRDEAVVVDLDAGVECMGRASVRGIDALITVVEPGARSLSTARTVATMARDLGIGVVGAVANKITDPAQTEDMAAQLEGLPIWASLPYETAVQRADLKHGAVWDAGSAFVPILRATTHHLLEATGRSPSAGNPSRS